MTENLGIIIEGKETAAWINIRDRVQKAIEETERELLINKCVLIYAETKIVELKKDLNT
jgi:hypothetical protein